MLSITGECFSPGLFSEDVSLPYYKPTFSGVDPLKLRLNNEEDLAKSNSEVKFRTYRYIKKKNYLEVFEGSLLF